MITIHQIRHSAHNQYPEQDPTLAPPARWTAVVQYCDTQLGNAREFARLRGMLRDARVPAPSTAGLLHLKWSRLRDKLPGFAAVTITARDTAQIDIAELAQRVTAVAPTQGPLSWREVEDELRLRVRAAETVLNIARSQVAMGNEFGPRYFGMCHLDFARF